MLLLLLSLDNAAYVRRKILPVGRVVPELRRDVLYAWRKGIVVKIASVDGDIFKHLTAVTIERLTARDTLPVRCTRPERALEGRLTCGGLFPDTQR